MEGKKLRITLKVDGKSLPFLVDRNSDEEVAFRKSAEHLNELLHEFREHYGTSQFDKETQLMYILLEQLKNTFLEKNDDDRFMKRFDSVIASLSDTILDDK